MNIVFIPPKYCCASTKERTRWRLVFNPHLVFSVNRVPVVEGIFSTGAIAAVVFILHLIAEHQRKTELAAVWVSNLAFDSLPSRSRRSLVVFGSAGVLASAIHC